MRKRGPLLLAGTCPACRSRRETEAPEGADGRPRLMSRGRCGINGCDGTISYRRQPRKPADPAEPPGPAPPAGGTPAMTTDQDQIPRYQPRHGKTAATPEEDRAAWAAQDSPGQPEDLTGPSTSAGQKPTGERSTPASIERLSKEGLSAAAEHAFRGIGEALNGVCAEDRPPYEEPDDIWIPTGDEAEGVGQPTGRLLARRLPDVPGGDASDAADIIALAIPLGIWLIRGLATWLPRLGRKHRKTVPGQVQAPETEAP